MGNFKELLEKANLLSQNPSLNSTNGLLVKLCRELNERFPAKKIVTTNIAPIEENTLVVEKPVKKETGRKKKNV